MNILHSALMCSIRLLIAPERAETLTSGESAATCF
nr:MAG TPA_asm: hypothetical protein [Caudoviricetes sp.]